ncbi:MAG: DUF1501 domain-containing protein [Planctomycetota bacterium]|nr:MAG: DUF1501 domain-containing protein [Planctomycetota bacterium]
MRHRKNRSSSLELSRRDLLRLSTAGLVTSATLPWLESAADAAQQPAARRSCILLWMNGGPSQMDTFDLKPGHENGGSFQEIATSVPGIKISEHLPKVAAMAEHLAIIRSMSTKEGDHGRATHLLRNGYLPQPPVRYPTLGSLVAHELGDPLAELPNFVSIAPFRNFNPAAYGPGFLGSQYAPLIVGQDNNAGAEEGAPEDDLTVADLAPPEGVGSDTVGERIDMLAWLNNRFVSDHAAPPAVGYQTAYERAIKLMRSKAAKVFDLDEEPAEVREAYGRNRFGQGCLLARRLVERGVPFVEVTLGGVNSIGWDTHTGNFETVKDLSGTLDPAWATLMSELDARGLLESTTIVWMGEFGRTPKINQNTGRDHYPAAWTTVLGGGGIRGGQVVGRTSADGTTVEDRKISVPDLLATVCTALGIDPMKQNVSNVGRPIRIVDTDAVPIDEVLL